VTYADLKVGLGRLAPQLIEHGEGVTAGEISLAEERIGVLPGEFREFLADLGWLAVRHYEIFGLGGSVPKHLNLVNITIDERSNFGLPQNMIPIMNNGGGDLYCFDGGGPGRANVLLWDHESSPRRGAYVAGRSFSAWLLDLLENLPDSREDACVLSRGASVWITGGTAIGFVLYGMI
jgi:hypothetical protein